MIGIYKITSPTKKIYVGQSIDIENRFKYYKRKSCNGQTILLRSFNKYGVENHKFEILCECEISDLNDKERYYQDLYSVIGKDGLNCILTKSSDKSGNISKETIQKLIIINTGKKVSIETRKKLSLNHSRHNLGKKHKLESIEKMSLNRKNKLVLGDNGRAKKVICTKTKIVYSCCKEASILLGYKYSTLRCMLNGSDKNKTTLTYI